MNKISSSVLLSMATIALSAASSGALIIDVSKLGINITTNDGIANSTYDGGSPALGIGNEDNETEKRSSDGVNTYTYQSWDLEAMFWNSSTEQLTVIGGFDYLNGNTGEAAGDLFIGGNVVLDLSRNGENLAGTGSFTTIENFTAIVNPHDIPASTPYEYLSGGQIIGVSGSYSVGFIENWSTLGLGLQGWKGDDKHYALVINTKGTAAGSLINAGNNLHFTLECGNDLITGKATPVSVPEPAIVSLLLVGLTALGFARRRKI
jgi:hypothetical protein